MLPNCLIGIIITKPIEFVNDEPPELSHWKFDLLSFFSVIYTQTIYIVEDIIVILGNKLTRMWRWWWWWWCLLNKRKENNFIVGIHLW